MNAEQARTRVAETFQQHFNKDRFLEFTRNLLNTFDESKAFARNRQYIKDAFKGHVSRFERLGTYTSPDNEKLDVLVVHLTDESKLERARAAIRNFVADHLTERQGKDAALVAFVSPTEKQWRFSYVRMEYAAIENESGRVHVETRLTPARRSSYIVGEGESSHTAQSRFLALLRDTEHLPTLAQIEEAFSVEAVTKEFFTQYVTLFSNIDAALRKIATEHRSVRSEFKEKNVSSADFAKKLMGQIVFLYFLQKKGWLGVGKGHDWGTGPHDFLRRLAKGEHGIYENLFNDVLEPLFYDTLATDRGHEAWCSRFKCRIPFLNGGLFEPLADYDWRKADISLPNKLFTNTDRSDSGDVGTGVFDVFDRYNFTVNEAEPLEKEVAIDPEMLGKVFENLIEENRRKGLGSFYTPRPIVHYMCQESLINYLESALNNDKVVVSRQDIATLIHLGSQISHYEAVETRYAIKMPKSIEQHSRLLDEKLADISICDPAVGSGAFPVGMMTEIVRARSALTPYFNDLKERTPYHFKRHAIQNSLYGVDIDPGAVEIAKLRLWLSLVVDEEDVKQIKPLPNLLYKIVPGDSLLRVEKTLFNEGLFQRIEKLKPTYFDESSSERKQLLRREIDDLIHELTNGRETFDFEIFFSEVFHGSGGFDVVIGNPPWVSNDSIPETQKAKLRSLYSYSVQSRFDLSCPFVELSLERLMGKKAAGAFVLPEHLWLGEYFISFREHTYQHWREVTSLKEGYFADVNNPASMLLLAKETCKDLVIGKSLPARTIQRRRQSKEFLEREVQVGSRGQEIRPFKVFFNLDYFTLKAAISRTTHCVFLDKVCIVTDGVQTANVLNEVMTDKPPKDRSRYHKALRRGKSISCRYGHLVWDGWWILKPEFASNFKRPGFSYDSPKRKLCFEAEKKILMRQTEPTIMATLDTEGFYFPNSIFQCIVKEQFESEVSLLYVLGLLNSSLIRRYYLIGSQVEGTTKPQLYINILKSIPLAKAELAQQKPIVAVVEKILAAKKYDAQASTSAMEREIDEQVYALYGLTVAEIEIVENSTELNVVSTR